jgi:hypothetical protein
MKPNNERAELTQEEAKVAIARLVHSHKPGLRGKVVVGSWTVAEENIEQYCSMGE